MVLDRNKIKTFEGETDALFAQALAIRQTVFVEEQGVDEFLEFDGNDGEAKHYLIYEDELPVATSRWRKTFEGIKLERFAVLPDYRKRGYGAMLLDAMLDDITPTPQLIFLHAQDAAIPFYEKFGFRIIGEMFIEANIIHYMMIYTRKTS